MENTSETSSLRSETPRPLDLEVPFAAHELFFSTTNSKGFITYGNDVFVRVSGYPVQRLIGAPHRIIRHPDTPRVVFQLLWDELGAGRSIAAYVKNLAANGAYYWVLAIVTPIKTGYLSIRLKPTSDFFKPIAGLYAELRKVESDIEESGQSKFRAIEASKVALQAALQRLGFPDYTAFQHHALLQEVCARRSAVQQTHTKVTGAAAKHALVFLRASRACSDNLAASPRYSNSSPTTP